MKNKSYGLENSLHVGIKLIFNQIINRKKNTMNESLKQYIDQRELSLLYTFNNQYYFEDQMGNVVSLKQIEKDYFNSLKKA